MLLRTGREPLELPLSSLLDVIYAWWVEGATEKDIAKFDQTLMAPPAGADLEERPEWSDDETDDSFERALGAGRTVA